MTYPQRLYSIREARTEAAAEASKTKDSEEALSEVAKNHIAALDAALEKVTADSQRIIDTYELNRPIEIEPEESIYQNIQRGGYAALAFVVRMRYKAKDTKAAGKRNHERGKIKSDKADRGRREGSARSTGSNRR
ncbi:hypothetical protein SARC_07125 [Sphaeroforma arctica JP610]|uniref:Uncharacterized protein n=1 Tax=Sphaeroforma arctica JP610 TaxID=667725 RepID=A0A0L0FV56_9EUKA|nr:hypothetical protein SARC_07125 [Sphaeroforma arctica JP610]KNC80519.1 hypothetical protein SARC_07125 [Sphaeroforma arctica JP610]|eukprot:XP_014154421.1 hypothetical protein SARC_07125 [Sphaeroforma arctica JP610]